METGERLEDLLTGGLKIIQNPSEYCFTSDSCLLADFVSCKHSDCVLEIGTGCGVISILLCHRLEPKKIVAVEIQENLAKLAQKNVNLNGFSQKMEIINENIIDFAKQNCEKFDVVVANPPYKKAGSCFQNSSLPKRIARHEILLDLQSLCISAKMSLKYGGKFFVCYDADRTAELLFVLKQNALEPKKLFFTQSDKSKNATQVFVECLKGGKEGIAVLPVKFR